MLEVLILLTASKTPSFQGANLTAPSVVRMAKTTATHSSLTMHNYITAKTNEAKVDTQLIVLLLTTQLA